MGFEDRQNSIIQDIHRRWNLVYRKICFEVATDIIIAWPVDTGRSRAGWMVGINNIPTGEPSGFKPNKGKGKKSRTERKQGATSFATRNLAMNVMAGEAFTIQDTFYFANNVHYAYYLEYGPHFSKQAPGGVVRKTVQKWQSKVGRISL